MLDDAAPSPSGLWLDRFGRELQVKQKPVYYIFQIMLFFYMLGTVASLYLVQNASIRHSHTFDGNFGPLYSERYNSAHWLSVSFCAVRIFTFISVLSMILYRRTVYCCGKRRPNACGVWWTSLLLACIVCELAVLTLSGSFFPSCNVPGYANNPCHDLRYCQVEEVWSDPGSRCTYKTAWDNAPALSDLRIDKDFLAFFIISCLFLLFDLVFLLVPLVLWLRIVPPDVNTDIEFDVLETEEIAVQQNKAMIRGQLRQRRNASPKKVPAPKKKKALVAHALMEATLSQKMDKKE